ncbi:hypothetical protein AVEN_162290-1 [Araneus ventricosus]|uniref:Major facilitator superfamily (MFS) profile domain-containing protein n=1 Tax=Araneus ventricosus TaxID=182803 RepID=A0A4Y2RCD7_ARAVE|nr:hypothetical protein AVEN_246468-1 [Araneus ventricosus]GBN73331.1 hypothetical protein AVEN_162290-1 [Araneus ventricosus]
MIHYLFHNRLESLRSAKNILISLPTKEMVVQKDTQKMEEELLKQQRKSQSSFFSTFKNLIIMFDAIPKRYVFALVGLSATTLAIVLQSNLSMAIVYMVQWSGQNSSSNLEPRECPGNQDTENNLKQMKQMSFGELNWSPEIQGMAIGIQFVGVLIGCIPGGRLAEIYGSKITMISTLLLASFTTALLPWAAYLSVYAFMLCRVVVGLGIVSF